MYLCRRAAAAAGRRLAAAAAAAADGTPPSARSLWSPFKPDFGVYEVVTPGKVSGPRTVPECVTLPPYAASGVPDDEPDQRAAPEVHDRGRIEMLRESCKLARWVLDRAAGSLRPGVTTDELDRFVHDLIVDNNAYPSPLNYNGFPKSVCTSVNNVVCHGVPDDRPLRDGDLVSVDVSLYLNGFHGDCAAACRVGDVDERGRRLADVAEACTLAGVAACGPGRPFADIGLAVEKVAFRHGHRVVASITGHGIGTYFHGPPVIYHSSMHVYPGLMKPGMVFTVEPVVCQGTSEVEMLDDGWSIVTADDSRGAQFEHTILITEQGYEILTA